MSISLRHHRVPSTAQKCLADIRSLTAALPTFRMTMLEIKYDNAEVQVIIQRLEFLI
jgi:hypothetical protein